MKKVVLALQGPLKTLKCRLTFGEHVDKAVDLALNALICFNSFGKSWRDITWINIQTFLTSSSEWQDQCPTFLCTASTVQMESFVYITWNWTPKCRTLYHIYPWFYTSITYSHDYYYRPVLSHFMSIPAWIPRHWTSTHSLPKSKTKSWVCFFTRSNHNFLNISAFLSREYRCEHPAHVTGEHRRNT